MSKSIELKKAIGTDRFWDMLDAKRRARMSRVDDMPPKTRVLVHEYGLNVVQAFLDVGVSEPRHIQHLVETVLNEFSPTRGSSSLQGTRRADGIKSDEPIAR